jgi:hypothetical protein
MPAIFLFLIALVGAHEASAQNGVHAILFDSYMTPAAGAQDVLTLQHIAASAADRWLPLKLGDERTRLTRAGGILYRSGKFLLFDMPQDHMLMVVAHEVFGHGTRFRELGRGRIGYGFDPPIPYGEGEAFTSFRGEFPTSPLAMLSVSASGIEAQHVLSDAIADRSVSRGRLHYREAWLYFESRLTAITYIQSASPTSSEGHDVADFLERFEESCEAPCRPFSRRHVQRRALFALADPMLYYSIYAFASAYIAGGQTTAPVPMLPIGGRVRALPIFGYALAPYGTEWTLRALLAGQRAEEGTGHRAEGKGQRAEGKGQRAEGKGQRAEGKGQSGWPVAIGTFGVNSFSVRIGDTGATTTWSVGAHVGDVLRLRGLRIGADVHVWRQPPPLAERTYDPLETGAAIAAVAVVPLPRLLRTRWSNGIQVTAGVKSEGYIPGELLAGGGYLRAGITLAPCKSG